MNKNLNGRTPNLLMRHLRAHRDMSVEEACELGRRAIYHATFRDAVSGGTVSGAPFHQLPQLYCSGKSAAGCCKARHDARFSKVAHVSSPPHQLPQSDD